jgi:hypothetical protein
MGTQPLVRPGIEPVTLGAVRTPGDASQRDQACLIKATNNYINIVNVSLFHRKYSIDLEKCEIQSLGQ